jgi:hypothetical protein
MEDVDFLPSEYRRRTRQRREMRWRLSGLGVTGIFITAVTTCQQFARLALQEQFAMAEAQASVVQTQTARLTELIDARQAAAAQAELITWLRHPWPRSRILANLVTPLPANVMLTSLHISRELPPANPAMPEPSQGAATNQQQNPYLKDLETLRAALGPGTVVAQLAGMTTDPGALYEYADLLANQDLVASAELLGVERVSDPTQASYRFSMRVIIKPALGQSPQNSGEPAAGTAAPRAGNIPG